MSKATGKKQTKPVLKPFKFAIQAVVLEVDGDKVLAERSVQAVVFYDVAAAKEWLDNFGANLASVVDADDAIAAQ